MPTEKIRVGIIAASMRNGWGRDAHIPALRALPEFEITAVSTALRRAVGLGKVSVTVLPATRRVRRNCG
jgi:predicted dehydrogenase